MAISIIQFIDEQFLKNFTEVNENVDPKNVNPCIQRAQDMYIHPALGTDLYNALKTKVSGSTVAGVYATLMEDYIMKALPYFTIYELLLPLTTKFRNKGVQSQSGENSQPLTLEDVQTIRNEYKNKGEWYLQRMIAYLCENSSSFPEYTSNSDGDDLKPEGSAYDSVIYLGTGRGKCKRELDTRA